MLRPDLGSLTLLLLCQDYMSLCVRIGKCDTICSYVYLLKLFNDGFSSSILSWRTETKLKILVSATQAFTRLAVA